MSIATKNSVNNDTGEEQTWNTNIQLLKMIIDKKKMFK